MTTEKINSDNTNPAWPLKPISKPCSLDQELTKDPLEDLSNLLSPWERVLLARHPHRPHSIDYINNVFTQFIELHGDRRFGNDPAILLGFAKLGTQPVLVMAQDKGKTTKEKVEKSFGMAKPEGYRKIIRGARLAEQFKLPIITLIDTPGAYPGIAAEERGQAQAIAESIQVFFEINTPIIAVVIGEGGSGGALALGVADKIFMQEHSIYSVISPESCASILWNSAEKACLAAEKLKINAQNCLQLGIIDKIISEPTGGAHQDPSTTFTIFKTTLEQELNDLIFKFQKMNKITHNSFAKLDKNTHWLHLRRQKFRKMGSAHIIESPNAKGDAKEKDLHISKQKLESSLV